MMLSLVALACAVLSAHPRGADFSLGQESGHVIFGRVLDGFEALRLAELEGSAEGYTERPVVIHDCGELDARGEAIEVVGVDSVASPP